MTQAQFSMRIPLELSEKLKNLSEATGRSKSYLATQALEGYIERESWQIAMIKKGIEQADNGQFATEEEMKELDAKWGYDAG